MKILADAHIPYLKDVAQQFGEVEFLAGNKFDKDSIRDKDVLIVRTVTHFDEKILSDTNVKLICSATIGYDHIDTKYCDANNIAWRTAPGCNASSVEQYVTATLLYLAYKHDFNLSNKTIGIVGVGNVGTKVAAACKKIGIRVLLNDPPRANNEPNNKSMFVDIETLQKEADIITFHTPLTKSGEYKTYHLADNEFFKSLSNKPFIINSSRGSVISTEAIKDAIKNNLITGAAIDCWENEPNIDRELLSLVDIATPHIAGYSADGKWTATKMSLENVNNFFNLGINPIKLMPIIEPEDNIIDLNDIPLDKQLPYAVWKTYLPTIESDNLKAEADKFTWFRSNYPLRREYHAYKVVNADEDVEKILKELGFVVKSN